MTNLTDSPIMTMRGSRGAEGPDYPSPLENHKAKGFLSNTGPDPLEYHKATEPAFDDGTLIVFLDHLSPHQLI